MSRHKWIRNAIVIEDQKLTIPGVYQIDQCERCGCILFHKYLGGCDYRKSYLLSDGKELNNRPECKLK